ncbi:helix-turn-helix domain-containing protein [Nitratireductor sp. ZSWI3]|uniref:helix-turn-helix domain-containing protein n=1 Tax=Nitratireductor sp. ZSWI3 TaxID=2966359 RepID=UPI0021501372|nr:helix-turn-helix transcriptional regulator [Nitratireductor sp. ZSWI3]MCR4265676.1 helix-turn-helix domain-containing protein [Nitratireductor sp. ZSWI3]
MTPLGAKIRQLRNERGVSQKEMAAAIGVSPAYLSALEHGRASPPNWAMVQKIIGYFNVIWDEADELQRIAELSHPRVVVDTAKLSPPATELANLLAMHIATLSDAQIIFLLERLREMTSDERDEAAGARRFDSDSAL